MSPSAGGWTLVGLGLSGALAQLWGLRNYRALPPLAPIRSTNLPRVSIVIPARNEAHNLPDLLDDLHQLHYPSCEIIVVDDQSSDGTAAAARAGGVRVVEAQPLPGWTGKAFACMTGAAAADGEWLLFTDADTRHAPDSLAAAVAMATRSGAAVVSVMPEQRCETVWEELVIPFLFASYFAAVRPERVNRTPPEALINGQYLLVRQDVYASIGGHGAVAGSLVEDVELAQHLCAAGHTIQLCRADGLVAVRMYRSWETVAEGFRKNSFAFLKRHPARGLAVAATTVLASLAGPAWVASWQGTTGHRIAAGSMLAVTMASFGVWVRAFGGRPALGMLQPVAATASLWIVLRSAAATVLGRPVTWKSRAYRPS